MTDDSFARENRHMLLYFLPLSDAQRDGALARIAPQHRNRLFRRGIGHAVLGETPMRWIMGERQLQQQSAQRSESSRAAAIDVSHVQDDAVADVVDTPPRRGTGRLDDDSSSASPDLGLLVTSSDLAGGFDEVQAASVSRRLQLSSPPVVAADEESRTTALVPRSINQNHNVVRPPQAQEDNAADDEDDYQEQELQVLMDALWGSYYGSFLNPIRDYISTALVIPTVDTLSHFGARSGLFLSLSAGGIGIWGWWVGAYTVPTLSSLSNMFSNVRSTVRGRVHYPPPSWSVWATAAIGGTSIGLSLYARHYVRGSRDSYKSDDDKKLRKWFFGIVAPYYVTLSTPAKTTFTCYY
jgi:hypothetical protein